MTGYKNRLQVTKMIWVKLLTLLLLFFSISIGYILFMPKVVPNLTINNYYKLVINKNESLYNVAGRLKYDGIINNPKIFTWALKLCGKDKSIRAGIYEINRPMSLYDLIVKLTLGKPDEISITIAEGATFKQVRQYIDNLPGITHLTLNMTESQIRSALKIPYPHMEGLIYPSTYYIAPNQSDLEIYQIAYRLTQAKLKDIWAKRNNNAVYHDPYNLLIMASLIQKETSVVEDMYKVSTVFNNRLRNSMRLQNDPAVFYGLGNKEHVTRQDFAIRTPYNTYLHYGLPPTPICNVSLKALEAAANPSDNYKLMYFIATGNGKSRFFYTFAEHNEAIHKYLSKNKSSVNKLIKVAKI